MIGSMSRFEVLTQYPSYLNWFQQQSTFQLMLKSNRSDCCISQSFSHFWAPQTGSGPLTLLSSHPIPCHWLLLLVQPSSWHSAHNRHSSQILAMAREMSALLRSEELLLLTSLKSNFTPDDTDLLGPLLEIIRIYLELINI